MRTALRDSVHVPSAAIAVLGVFVDLYNDWRGTSHLRHGV